MIRINAAFAAAKERGKKVRKKELAALMWPEAPETNRMRSIGNLASGRTTRIEPEWLNIIAEYCGVSIDFLLGNTNEV